MIVSTNRKNRLAWLSVVIRSRIPHHFSISLINAMCISNRKSNFLLQIFVSDYLLTYLLTYLISFVDCVLNMLTSIRPSIELCCIVVFDLSCNVLFCYFFFVLFFYFSSFWWRTKLCEYSILSDLLAFLTQIPAAFHETRRTDWSQQRNESTKLLYLGAIRQTPDPDKYGFHSRNNFEWMTKVTKVQGVRCTWRWRRCVLPECEVTPATKNNTL